MERSGLVSYIPQKFIERRNDNEAIISNFVRAVPTYRGMFITGVMGEGKTVLLSYIRNKIRQEVFHISSTDNSFTLSLSQA